MLTPGVVVLAMTTVAGFVVLYTTIGAAGTHATPAWQQRLALWGIAAVFSFPVCYATSVLALYLAGSRPFPRVLLALSAATVISALPATALIYTLDRAWLPTHTSDDLGALYLWVFAPMLLGSVFVLHIISRSSRRPDPVDAAAVSAASRRVPLPSAAASGEPPLTGSLIDGPASQSPFLGRLSAHPDADLIYLKMNDHYVEAVTSAGNEIILMRFADAVAELAGMGMQVHRSFWVSYRSVVRLERERHRRYVELAGAHKVPVSRTYLPAVRLAVEGLAAGGVVRPPAWTSGATPDPESAGPGAGGSPPLSKDPVPTTPPQRQPTVQERAPFRNDLVHTSDIVSRQNPQTSRPQ